MGEIAPGGKFCGGGETSTIGLTNNGNFLMAIELFAEFDPFMSEHIKRYGNPGKGFTSYISPSI